MEWGKTRDKEKLGKIGWVTIEGMSALSLHLLPSVHHLRCVEVS